MNDAGADADGHASEPGQRSGQPQQRDHRLLMLPVLAIVLVVDQLTKHAVRSRLAPGEGQMLVDPWIGIRHVENPGIAFGLLSDLGAPWVLILALSVAAVLVWFLLSMPRSSRLIQAGSGLVLGGAAGNIIDRIAFDVVTDFIRLAPFPNFNVADMGIVVGITMVIAGQVHHDRIHGEPPADREGRQS